MLKVHQDIEHVDGSTVDMVRSPAMRRILIGYTIIAATMATFSIVTFIIFYIFAHLGWTVLSNNFVLVVITVCIALKGERMGKELELAKEDQHKAVIYESVLLLTELAMVKSSENKQKLVEKVERFCRSLQDTEMFAQPGYIQVPDKYKPQCMSSPPCRCSQLSKTSISMVILVLVTIVI